ncbi:MAG: molybdopterin-dependent oxidoreductase [Alphaproteobacteria bacterium]|nr:molybdopterin-dependent oxidoreductase [Alphaproteobacteria bacterium]
MPQDSVELRYSACPHDCPSTCALEIEVLGPDRIGRVRGARDNDYTAGVVCAKVARYAERIHHPDRLTQPMRRTGPKGSGRFVPISWDEAMDEVVTKFREAEDKYGSETVWPYYFAGTMGFVMCDGINRLRHAKRYSGQHSTICTTLAWSGFMAGTGALMGPDPREMAKSDLVVIWGTNPVNTQVNVMTHVTRARKERGAKIVVIDTYRTGTAAQADLFLCVKPGTDAALACAVMHVLFRDGKADWEWMRSNTDDPEGLAEHLKERSPAWAEAICGVPAAEIEELAGLIGATPRTYLRLGYGFCRGRNGVLSMHSAACIASVTGAWRHEGGGAFHNNGGIYHWDRSMIEGLDVRDPSVRVLDQSRIGPVLTGDTRDLGDGPPVTAMLIQNTNPMMVAPDLGRVHEGFARDDLFVCVHEQFMTETAEMADIVLPATMFMEHDDLYQGGGHQYIIWGPKLIDGPEGCRSNHAVICDLARRLGVADDHPGFAVSSKHLASQVMEASGWGDLDTLIEKRWIDAQPSFEDSHFINGFGHDDGRFHFRADWSHKMNGFGPRGVPETMPDLPDFWNVIDAADDEQPFRLVTAPARNFLNSSFTETATSRQREDKPTAQIDRDAAAELGVTDGGKVRIGNAQGSVLLHARLVDGQQRNTVIVESVWPNHAFEEGIGINLLVSAEPGAPIGGGLFHDTAVWIEAA